MFTLAFSGQANADPSVRGGGVWLNGIQWNGWSLNGGHNGVGLKVKKLPKLPLAGGMELQSLKVEGGQLVGVTRVAAE